MVLRPASHGSDRQPEFLSDNDDRTRTASAVADRRARAGAERQYIALGERVRGPAQGAGGPVGVWGQAARARRRRARGEPGY